jgi:hypothetical protein
MISRGGTVYIGVITAGFRNVVISWRREQSDAECE